MSPLFELAVIRRFSPSPLRRPPSPLGEPPHGPDLTRVLALYSAARGRR
jgi:hypothetical protein